MQAGVAAAEFTLEPGLILQGHLSRNASHAVMYPLEARAIVFNDNHASVCIITLDVIGVELEFTDDAMRAIAEQAIQRGTGARGLRAIMEEVLLNVMYELPSREDVTKCLVDRDVVLTGVNPTLVPRESKKTRERQQRTA